jgi:hypothetical protein
MESPDQTAQTSTALVPYAPSPADRHALEKMGHEAGTLLCLKLVPKIQAQKARSDIFEITLRELGSALEAIEGAAPIQQHPQVRPLLAWVIINPFNLVPASVNSPLVSITDEELVLLGQSLAPCLISNSNSASAVDEWILRYRALGELDETQAWFRPLINEIAKTLLADASWGAKGRLYFGATLSVLDMVSDIYMIVEYWNAPGKENTAVALLTCLLMNLAVQLFIVIAQNVKAPRRVLFREMLYVLSCTKVGVDVYRVAVGAKQETYHSFNADKELGE